jgi:hypothetical protein
MMYDSLKQHGESMNKELALKLGQIVGVCFLIAGVAACNMDRIESTPLLMLVGGVIYGGCRLAAWLSPAKK